MVSQSPGPDKLIYTNFSDLNYHCPDLGPYYLPHGLLLPPSNQSVCFLFCTAHLSSAWCQNNLSITHILSCHSPFPCHLQGSPSYLEEQRQTKALIFLVNLALLIPCLAATTCSPSLHGHCFTSWHVYSRSFQIFLLPGMLPHEFYPQFLFIHQDSVQESLAQNFLPNPTAEVGVSLSCSQYHPVSVLSTRY